MLINGGLNCVFQDQKVVVDDDNGTFAKRSSYLKLIQKKVLCVELYILLLII